MTLQEILLAKGLSNEDIESVIGEMKQNKIFTAGEENLDIRYSKLKTDHDNLVAQHDESTKLIEQLKSGTKNIDTLQAKITAYESQITELQQTLKQTQLDSAVKVALMDAKATDVEYMTFRLKEKGDLELDENGQIKGIDDRLAGLKTQYPAFFNGADTKRSVVPLDLPDRNTANNSAVTKESYDKMSYKQKVEFKQNNPEAYAQMKG